MEVGSHGVESLNASRESDRVAMNFNPEIQHYLAQSGNPLVTSTAPIDATGSRPSAMDVDSVDAGVSEPILTTVLSADSFTFPSVTDDLNFAPLESQCPVFGSMGDYPAASTIPEAPEGAQTVEILDEDRSAELAAADFQPAVTEETSQESFDDMVVLEDGMVTVATVVAENAAPVEEGAGVDCANTDLTTSTNDAVLVAEDTQLPDSPIQELENAPVEGPFTSEVPLGFPKGDEPDTEEVPGTEEIPDTDGHPIEVLPEKVQSGPAVVCETTVQELPSKQLTGSEEGDLEEEPLIDERQGEVTGDVKAPKLETVPSRDEQSDEDTGNVEVSELETGPAIVVEQPGEDTGDVKVPELETGPLTGKQSGENSNDEKVPKLETLPLIGEQLGGETGDVEAPKLETGCLPGEQSIQGTDDVEVPGSAFPAEKLSEVTELEQIQLSAVHAGKLPEGTESEHTHPSTIYSEKIPEVTEAKQTQPDEEEDVAKSGILEKDAEALKGRELLKKFGKKRFTGNIVGYDPNSRWFKVVYEDGDEEELEWAEIEAILVDPGAVPETVSKKRSHPGDADDEGSQRTPKKAKKPVAATPKKKGKSPDLKKQKTSTSGKKKGKGSKSPGISAKSPGSNGKALKTKQEESEKSNSKKKFNSKKKLRKTKGLDQLHSGSTKKIPGKKVEQRVKSEPDSQPGKSSLKTQNKVHLKGSQRQQLTTPKSSTVSKIRKDVQKSSSQKLQAPEIQKAKKKEPLQEQKMSPKSVGKQKPAKKGTNDSEQQPQVKSPNQKAGMKRKADVIQSDSSQGKRMRRGDTGEIVGQALQLKGATAVKVDEANAPSVQKSNAVEQGVSLVGRIIRKKFGGKFYSGEVVAFVKKTKYYKVVYEDGDEEEVEWSNLEQMLTLENRNDANASKIACKKSTPARPASQKKTSGGKRKGGKNKIKLHTPSRYVAVTRSKSTVSS